MKIKLPAVFSALNILYLSYDREKHLHIFSVIDRSIITFNKPSPTKSKDDSFISTTAISDYFDQSSTFTFYSSSMLNNKSGLRYLNLVKEKSLFLNSYLMAFKRYESQSFDSIFALKDNFHKCLISQLHVNSFYSSGINFLIILS